MKKTTPLVAMLAILGSCATARPQDPVADSTSTIAAVTTTIQGDTLRPPPGFVDVDREPVVVKKVEPVYPGLAMRAGMEGKVWVKVWVDTQGRAHDVVLLKSDADVFNGAAIEAAKQFLFEPAQIKGKPVDVWVSIPFKFRLAEKKPPIIGATDTITAGPIPGAMYDFVRDVLQGPVPDTVHVNEFVAPGTQSIAGGYLRPLREALEEQRKGKESIEQKGRKVVFFTMGTSEGGSGYLVSRTENPGKTASAHYHTIVVAKDPGGSWKITFWQSWQGGRSTR
ncbi:MAG TPA: energy transducer TonB [Bacteroidota bacterium]|nr:energy transducer TonB [Bacteroidota bacterium]